MVTPEKQVSMPEPAEQVVSRVLEPGEKILWSGRPNVEVSLDQHAKRRSRRRIVGIGATVLVVLWIARERLGFSRLADMVPVLSDNPKLALPLAVILVVIALIYIFKLDNVSRLDRYFHSLAYAITDRRLLILENSKLKESYTPEQVRQPIVRERGPGYADVIFDKRSQHSGVDDTTSEDPVFRERRHVGFKALPNAQEMKQRIEDWIQNHHNRAADEVVDFVESAPARSAAAAPKGGIQIANRTLGLTLVAPEEWQVQVRAKKKPQGKIFLDRENWNQLGESDTWNLVKIEGPSRCRIEIEVFETAPTMTFEKLANNKLSDSIAGPVIESEAHCEINQLRGFFVTRRNDLQMNQQTNEAGVAAVVAPERHTVLHDGRRQIYVISTWPEDSVDLKRAVDAVVESIEVS